MNAVTFSNCEGSITIDGAADYTAAIAMNCSNADYYFSYISHVHGSDIVKIGARSVSGNK